MKNTPTHQLLSDQDYYLKTPAQGNPPEGRWPQGTKVALVKKQSSYSRVIGPGDISGWVSTSALEPLQKLNLASDNAYASEPSLTSESVPDLEKDLDPGLQHALLALRHGMELDPAFAFTDNDGIKRIDV